MIKRTVTYTNFDGVEVKEDLYFHLSKAEMTEMEVSIPGGLGNAIQTIIKSGDNGELLKLFKTIILKAYGVKSEDGRRFIKTDRLIEEFVQTEAYSELFMSLLQSDDGAAAFIKGIMPPDVVKQADATQLPK